jgi:hypothetical protein
MTFCEFIPCDSMTGETLHVLQALAMQGKHPSERLADVLISSTPEGCYPASVNHNSSHVCLVHPTTQPWLTRGRRAISQVMRTCMDVLSQSSALCSQPANIGRMLA